MGDIGRHTSPETIADYQALRRSGATISEAVRASGIGSWSTGKRHDPPDAPPSTPGAHSAPSVPTVPGSVEDLIERAVERRLAMMGGYTVPPDPAPSAIADEPDPKPPPIPPPGRTTIVEDATQAERTLFISDLHVPFHDPLAWSAAMGVIDDFRPQLILLAGDMFDCYAISDHDQDPGRADYLQDEFDAAQPLWQELEDRRNGATVVYWKGNHEERIDRMQRRNTALFRLRSLEIPIAAEMPKAWHYHPNQTRYRLGALSCIHGDLKGRGTNSMHAAAGILKKLRTSAIFGHLHRCQVFYETNADGTVRGGFANGHLCDVEQARYISSPDWQQAVSTIEYDWGRNLFAVDHHLIFGGSVLFRGRTITASSPGK